jgi:pimeloyl-ACP methyl ester carboxylesterase
MSAAGRLPGEVESRWIELDGPVHYATWDGPADGPTFVLVHGLGGSHVNWFSVAPALARRGRVHAIDLAGFGRTPLEDRRATIGSNRRLLHRFLEATGAAPAILVGNSMGGAISAIEAAEEQEAVAGLVLVDPALPRSLNGGADPVVAALFATYLVPGVGERFMRRRARSLGPERLVEETMRLCCVDPSRVDPEVIAASVAMARERAAMPWANKAFLEAARSLIRRLARRERFLATLHRISCPTLLVEGDRDRLVPLAAARSVAQMRPDWTFQVFEDIGHVPMLEDPGLFLATVEVWLEGAGRAAVSISAADNARRARENAAEPSR